MTNFALAMLVGILCTAHLNVPFALMKMVRAAQADFDRQLFAKDACRSNFDASSNRKFGFSENNEMPCYFERMDFGTIETKGHWPKSVCILVRHVHGKTHSPGDDPCSYQ